MNLEIKYYRFTDPYTGVVSKDLGWAVSKTVRAVTIKGDIVVKDEQQVHASEFKPRYPGIEEITEEEYDALDTKGESATAQLRRESNISRAKRLLDVAALEEIEVVASEVAAKFKDLHAKLK